MDKRSEKAVVFIFARGGSKGVPRKNIRDLAGKPLITYAIDVGKATAGVQTVIVSTDDPEIAEVSRLHGAEVPFQRPVNLAQDDSAEWLAWRHAIQWYLERRGDFDVFISLPATSPFRCAEDVERTVSALIESEATDVVITVTKSTRSPYFNMVNIGKDGAASLVLPPEGAIIRRQDAPQVYSVTTVAYAARPQFVLRADGIFSGNVKAVVVPEERSLDIDTPFDFLVAEALAPQVLR